MTASGSHSYFMSLLIQFELGQKINRWTVLGRAGTKDNGKAVWLCQCDCGTIKRVLGKQLRNGRSRSCGCLQREITAAQSTKHGHAVGLTHGKKRSAEYNVWAGIKRRCYNEKDGNYHNYGGRGITMCDRWFDSFSAFYEDVGPRPSKEHSLDRIENNGNYEPGNVRWCRKDDQMRNQRTNRWIEYNGERRILTDWAIYLGVSIAKFKGPLKRGKTYEEIIAHFLSQKALRS